MKIPQKPIIFAGMAITVIVIAGLCVFFAIQVIKQGEAPKLGEFIGYVNEYTALEKLSDSTYRATISSLPALTPDGLLIKPRWQENGDGYIADHNIFTALVSGRDTEVEALYNADGGAIEKGQKSAWSPQVFLDGEEVSPISDIPTLLETDPINENYENNVLEWDYGICKRRLRLIEGMVQELYIFDEDPGGDLIIKSNTESNLEPAGYFAVDAEDLPLENFTVLGDEKSVSADDFIEAEYPITIDDSYTAYGTLEDGYLMSYDMGSYSCAGGDARYVINGYYHIGVGQYETSRGYARIRRAFDYFDTSAIPSEADISSATMRLRIKDWDTERNFYVRIQNGQPDHPSIPLRASDYNKDFYSGNGGQFYTDNLEYNQFVEIPLTSQGVSWIQKGAGAITKFALRSTEDISCSFAGDYSNTIGWWSARIGNGYKPELVIEYTTGPPPQIAINPSSLDFGSVVEGSSANRNFTITNSGGSELTGYVPGLSAPFSCVSNCSFSINPGDSENVTIRFSPTAQGSFSDAAIFQNNAGGNVYRSVSGNGTIAGCIPANTADTNYTISSYTLGGNTTCFIRTGTTEGVERGDITIGSGITVQMESNTELVFNQGKSIYIQGKIAKTASNSVIKKGNIAICECTTGPCCDGCNYRPSSYTCDTDDESQFRCSGGCGGDIERRERDYTQKCSGDSQYCDGAKTYGSWSSWGYYSSCDDDDRCIEIPAEYDTYCEYDPGCVGGDECDRDSDCPSDTSCSGFSSTCDESGTYRDYYCDRPSASDSTCEYSTQNCSRDTDNDSCSGPSSACGYGSCDSDEKPTNWNCSGGSCSDYSCTYDSDCAPSCSGSLTCGAADEDSITLNYSFSNCGTIKLYWGSTFIASLGNGTKSGSKTHSGLDPDRSYSYNIKEGSNTIASRTCSTEAGGGWGCDYCVTTEPFNAPFMFNVGQTVTWVAEAPPSSVVWTGDCTGTGDECRRSYSSPGRYEAYATVSGERHYETAGVCDYGNSYTSSCSSAYNFGDGGSKDYMCGEEHYYKVTVPSGQTCDIEWELYTPNKPFGWGWTSQGVSDQGYNLYVSDGGCPSESSHDCKQTVHRYYGNTKTCDVSGASSGTYYAYVTYENWGYWFPSPAIYYKITATLSNCTGGGETYTLEKHIWAMDYKQDTLYCNSGDTRVGNGECVPDDNEDVTSEARGNNGWYCKFDDCWICQAGGTIKITCQE